MLQPNPQDIKTIGCSYCCWGRGGGRSSCSRLRGGLRRSARLYPAFSSPDSTFYFEDEGI